MEQLQTNQTSNCSVCPKFEYTFSILGKKWNGLILEILMGGPKRFKDLSQGIDGVSDRVLTERLKELEGEGLVTRPTTDGVPDRVGYCLTAKGEDLRSIMDSVHNWADEWVCGID